VEGFFKRHHLTHKTLEPTGFTGAVKNQRLALDFFSVPKKKKPAKSDTNHIQKQFFLAG